MSLATKKTETYEELCLNTLAKLTIEEDYSINLINEYILLVNNEQSFKFSVEILRNSIQTSIDLEGDLNKGGSIDTIQIASDGGYVFVFDIFILRQTEELYKLVKDFLGGFFQCEAISKIFFDCKGDSTAIHDHISVCPNNVIDLQIYHILLNQIPQLNTNAKDTNTSFMPGLNTTLTAFNCPLNHLKSEMKKLFTESEVGVYKTRPISTKFIEYAALDVKYLNQVKENMEKMIIQSGLDLEFIEYLMKVATQKYARSICKKFIQEE